MNVDGLVYLTMSKTGLSTLHLRTQILSILDEDGLAPDELSSVTQVSRATIYKIINLETDYTQRAIGRKIAEGTGRSFKIEGDKIYFTKKVSENLTDTDLEIARMVENIKLRPDMQEIYDLLMRMPEKKRESILEFLKGMVDDID